MNSNKTLNKSNLRQYCLKHMQNNQVCIQSALKDYYPNNTPVGDNSPFGAIISMAQIQAITDVLRHFGIPFTWEDTHPTKPDDKDADAALKAEEPLPKLDYSRGRTFDI